MGFKSLCVLLSFCLLFTSAALAQTAAGSQSGQTDKQDEAQKALEKKALSLLEEIVGESQSLKVPENRARIQAGVADMLWTRDEKRSRALFSDAANSFSQVTAPESNDQQFVNWMNQVFSTRREIIMIIARRDPVLARELLASSRPTLNAR